MYINWYFLHVFSPSSLHWLIYHLEVKSNIWILIAIGNVIVDSITLLTDCNQPLNTRFIDGTFLFLVLQHINGYE